MQIPFYRPSLTAAETSEVLDCLKSGWLTTGPRTKRFEQEFAAYVAQKHAVALNSCTAALHLALEAIGLQAGDTAVLLHLGLDPARLRTIVLNSHVRMMSCPCGRTS